MRYRLRTLLIVLTLGPPVLALGWWKHETWRAEQARREAKEAEMRANLAQRSATRAAAMARLTALRAIAAQAQAQAEAEARSMSEVERLQQKGYLPYPASPRRNQPAPEEPRE
jgi:Tfp pilus assembly protein PilO